MNIVEEGLLRMWIMIAQTNGYVGWRLGPTARWKAKQYCKYKHNHNLDI